MFTGLLSAVILLTVGGAACARVQSLYRYRPAPARLVRSVVAAIAIGALLLVETAAFWFLGRHGYAPPRLVSPLWGAAIGSTAGFAVFVAFTVEASRLRQPDEAIGAQVLGCLAFLAAPLAGGIAGVLLTLVP